MYKSTKSTNLNSILKIKKETLQNAFNIQCSPEGGDREPISGPLLSLDSELFRFSI